MTDRRLQDVSVQFGPTMRDVAVRQSDVLKTLCAVDEGYKVYSMPVVLCTSSIDNRRQSRLAVEQSLHSEHTFVVPFVVHKDIKDALHQRSRASLFLRLLYAGFARCCQLWL